MDIKSSYILKLSLQEMAMRKLAVILWKDPKIFAMIRKIENDCQMSAPSIVWEATYKMSKIPLPKSLSKQLKPMLKAVGFEVFKWRLIHEPYLPETSKTINTHVSKKLCFTTAGALDYRSTAEELVRCNVLDIVKRFELACLYCLEDYIPALWEKLPMQNKQTYVQSEDQTPHLEIFLNHILEREKSKLFDLPRTVSPRNSFEYSALLCHKTLAEFYLRKLPKVKRKASLTRTIKFLIKYRYCKMNGFGLFNRKSNSQKLTDTVCHLLSLMTPEEQFRTLHKLPCCEILECFLTWPWLHVALDVADVIWTFLPECKYCDLVRTIHKNLDKGIGFDNYFPFFYQNLYLRCPDEFRKHFLEEEHRSLSFFKNAVFDKDIESIKLIFKNVCSAERVRLLTTEKGLDLIMISIHWHIIEEFLRDSTPTREEKQRLKYAFQRYVSILQRILNNGVIFPRHEKFFEFVDEAEASAIKRSSETEMLTTVKKFASEKVNSTD